MRKAILIFLQMTYSATSDSLSSRKQPRLLSKYNGESTNFLSGNLGNVKPITASIIQDSEYALKQAATTSLHSILVEHMGFTGSEVVAPLDLSPDVDELGNVHVRFKQHWGGFPIEGASMVMHISGKDGTVFAVNGEFHSGEPNRASGGTLGCEKAVNMALKEYGIRSGHWESDCEETAVQGRDGKPHLAYKRLRGYHRHGDSYRRDLVFASLDSGKLLAVHPKVYGARSLQTFDSSNRTPYLLSDSPNKINSSDVIGNEAHNNTIDAYNFFNLAFKRPSLDGMDMVIKTYVHFGTNFSNSYFSPLGLDGAPTGPVLVYGDGDGVEFTSFSRGLDVVTHEYSHGVTYFTSNLAYQDESGALNEAFSDIMGAAADRMILGKSPRDVFLIGEDVVLDPTNGYAVRDLSNPGVYGDPDHYSVRYIGADDYGGVHTNSAIITTAFALMVQGGVHPRSQVVVPPVNADFDLSIWYTSQIFYLANTLCFTEGSDMLVARECTLLVISKSNVPSSYIDAWTASFTKAWDAVGVRAVQPLSNGVTLSNLALPLDGDVQVYRLDETVPSGYTVTCSVAGSNGDADVTVRLGQYPSVTPPTTVNDCWSMTIGTSVEKCTTGPAPFGSTAYVAVSAFQAFTGLSLQCQMTPPCKTKASRCTNRTDCCSKNLTCDGLTIATRTCKACKALNGSCVRNSQCCAGSQCKNGKCKAMK